MKVITVQFLIAKQPARSDTAAAMWIVAIYVHDLKRRLLYCCRVAISHTHTCTCTRTHAHAHAHTHAHKHTQTQLTHKMECGIISTPFASATSCKEAREFVRVSPTYRCPEQDHIWSCKQRGVCGWSGRLLKAESAVRSYILYNIQTYWLFNHRTIGISLHA